MSSLVSFCGIFNVLDKTKARTKNFRPRLSVLSKMRIPPRLSLKPGGKIIKLVYARSGYQINIPHVTDKRNKQYKDIKTAFADIVHAADNERYRR